MQAKTLNQAFADSYESQSSSHNHQQGSAGSKGKRQIESKTLLEAMKIDKDHALLIMNHWKQWLKDGAATRAANEFRSFDEWLPYRYQDAALEYGAIIPDID